ncbi:hypothetical protein F7984_08130 [Pradoshia sp. D12]|uniref:hypothetical protein n=1 Tax=Bacillaceae TaxID=186817 RepID=UPI0011276015|nr:MULTISPECIES: hypothetical protein [Bacillaceae]QFK71216.1 hypothetical protein F7984_08130 [Pradoshia sp. D12]TPF73009.1 hypothetical protein FHY44_04520 [Bacillus sp. D12]
MKKMLIALGVTLLFTGCSASESSIKVNEKVEIESSVGQKAVHTYIKKAKAHLSTAPNYNPAVYDDRLMKMASDSFQISVEEATEIYKAYEYDK